MKMMSAGRTDGVFQFESGGIRGVLQSFRPEKNRGSYSHNLTLPSGTYGLDTQIY